MSGIQSFAPVIHADSRVLVLGSMPGVKSLLKTEYYGNPRNHFWTIIYGMFGLEPDGDYEKRLRFLQEKKIALWDVIAECEREGSLDANIRGEKPNNLPCLLSEYPSLSCLAFNGGKSWQLYRRYFEGRIDGRRLALLQLPSTSPIPGKFNKTSADKMAVWSEIRRFL